MRKSFDISELRSNLAVSVVLYSRTHLDQCGNSIPDSHITMTSASSSLVAAAAASCATVCDGKSVLEFTSSARQSAYQQTATSAKYALLRCSGPVVAYLTAVREVLGSNRAAGSCVYRTTTVIYSLGHQLCAPFLQCLGQLSLLPSVGR